MSCPAISLDLEELEHLALGVGPSLDVEDLLEESVHVDGCEIGDAPSVDPLL